MLVVTTGQFATEPPQRPKTISGSQYFKSSAYLNLSLSSFLYFDCVQIIIYSSDDGNARYKVDFAMHRMCSSPLSETHNSYPLPPIRPVLVSNKLPNWWSLSDQYNEKGTFSIVFNGVFEPFLNCYLLRWRVINRPSLKPRFKLS